MNVCLHSELNNNRFEVSHVHKVECVVPWLNDTLVFFTISLQLCQQLKDKVGRDRSKKVPLHLRAALFSFFNVFNKVSKQFAFHNQF